MMLGGFYTFGKSIFSDFGGKSAEFAIIPKVMESLKHIFAVQVTIGFYFTAVLSREGSVYTFSWGTHARLGHNNVPNVVSLVFSQVPRTDCQSRKSLLEIATSCY